MIETKGTKIIATAVAVIAVSALASPGWAATCNVPSGSHPNIQTAIDDIGCAPIIVAAGSFPGTVVIARTVNLTGAGSDQTFLQGQIQVSDGVVHLNGLHITGPGDALWAHSGGEIAGFDLVVVNGAVHVNSIFSDGFELGDTSAWSAATP